LHISISCHFIEVLQLGIIFFIWASIPWIVSIHTAAVMKERVEVWRYKWRSSKQNRSFYRIDDKTHGGIIGNFGWGFCL